MPARTKDRRCTVSGCERTDYKAKGLCGLHYDRRLNGTPLDQRTRTKASGEYCSVMGCKNEARARGWCSMHYGRHRLNGDVNWKPEGRREYGSGKDWHEAPHGYIVRFEPTNPQAGPNGQVYQHRHVMAAHLDRRLKPHENVHHINGNRADNRIENLELWITSQPSGQRPQDLLDYARAIIAEYGDQ